MPKNFIERPRKNEKDEAIRYVKHLLVQAREENRGEDIEKLEELLRLLHTKKYGLVWEEHAEVVEEEMRMKIPVFLEDTDRKIVGNPDSDDYNFLLEGDNLHSLHLLEKTHAGKIDVIYIDPPYNTGNKDFIYNDKIVDKKDGYSHSKWLSFMSKRLEIARRLLSDSGVVFISIDDNEQAQLKLLCDEIFGEGNFIANFIWEKTQHFGRQKLNSYKNGDYILCYSKKLWNDGQLSELLVERVKEEFEDAPLYNASNNEHILIFPKGTVKFNLPDGTYEHSTDEKYELMNEVLVQNGVNVNSFGLQFKSRWTNETVQQEIQNGTIFWVKTQRFAIRSIYAKGKKSTEAPRQVIFTNQKNPARALSRFGKRVGTSEIATNELSKVLGESIFSYPKPTSLIEYLISLFVKNRKHNMNITILDFFAGSGTTGHAVAQLNKEDGGGRKYILCTNNENNICEEVTYKRLNNIQDELPHNLKYFKTNFIDKRHFPDITLEKELLKYITPLVELEFGIDISNPSVQIILTEEHLKALLQNQELQAGVTLFIHPDVFLDTKEQEQLSELYITLQEIPDYFFGKELWS